jgi:hypothetical protein
MSGARHPGELIVSPHLRTRDHRASAGETFPHPRYAASHFRKSRSLRVKSIKNVHAQGARDLTIATAATARC